MLFDKHCVETILNLGCKFELNTFFYYEFKHLDKSMCIDLLE